MSKRRRASLSTHAAAKANVSKLDGERSRLQLGACNVSGGEDSSTGRAYFFEDSQRDDSDGPDNGIAPEL